MPSPGAQDARRSKPTPNGVAALNPLARRLRDLQSAWGVVAPLSAADVGREIVTTGRDWQTELNHLARSAQAPDEATLARIRHGLEQLTQRICDVVFSIPLRDLQLILPAAVRADRLGALDLLDVLATQAFEEEQQLANRLVLLDYLITCLCADGAADGATMPHDPALLTPAFQALCQRAESQYAHRLPEIEAQFFTAANLAADLLDEQQQQALRARKVELGRGYFAPTMLRAIVTYNGALMQCTAAEAWDRGNWGVAPEVPLVEPEDATVFESPALKAIHSACLRRMAGEPQETGPVDAIAWALDLDYPSGSERRALHAGKVDASDLETTIVMVGLVCRSLEVLAVELEEIGLAPERLAERWVKDIDERVKIHVNESLARNTYDAAQGLSALRNRFLYDAMRHVYRETRSGPPKARATSSASEERQTRREAASLATEALADNRPRTRARPDDTPDWRDHPWRLLAPAILVLVLGALGGLQHFGWLDLAGTGLDRFNGSELEAISPYLAEGRRNGDGAGVAFVGTLDERYLALPPTGRDAAAQDLVEGLQTLGIRQIMIYDENQQLRIQALGDSVRTL